MTRDDFAALHTKDAPLVLFNIWDAGSAQAVAKAGAKVIATGSASLAGALGYEDGEAIGIDELLTMVRRISASIPLPLSVDFETGFASDLHGLSANAAALYEAGAIGCNLEDRLLDGSGLRAVEEQAARIKTVAAAGLFVNARTDTFLAELMAGKDPNRTELIDEALERAHAYCETGAGSFFVPGLSDPALILQVCEASPIPVNVMRLPGMVSNGELANLGVARISYGPGPWRAAMASVESEAREALGQ
ncbi:MAG: isocitrate lyase/phosphoenolpyruvate mutase family protein [Pseudomonadota bacterium]